MRSYTYRKFWSIILFGVTSVLFLSGCEHKIINQYTLPSGSPLLKVFSNATVELKVLELVREGNSVKINAEIIKIKNYTPLEYKEPLLNQEEKVDIYFSGIGYPDDWKTNSLSKGSIVSLKIRCLDGRVNSKDIFKKEDCYWNANEEDIEVI